MKIGCMTSAWPPAILPKYTVIGDIRESRLQIILLFCHGLSELEAKNTGI